MISGLGKMEKAYAVSPFSFFLHGTHHSEGGQQSLQGKAKGILFHSDEDYFEMITAAESTTLPADRDSIYFLHTLGVTDYSQYNNIFLPNILVSWESYFPSPLFQMIFGSIFVLIQVAK